MTTMSLALSLVFCFAPTKAEPEPVTHADADEAARVESKGDVSIYEFADEELTGEHLTPDGDLIPWRRPPSHPSMIALRPHFLPELVVLALDV